MVKTIVLNVRSRAPVIAESKAALRSRRSDKHAYVHFETLKLLRTILTEKRWAIFKAIAGKGPLTFREAADMLDRVVKGVRMDLTAVIKAGIVDQAQDGVVFPYATTGNDARL